MLTCCVFIYASIGLKAMEEPGYLINGTACEKSTPQFPTYDITMKRKSSYWYVIKTVLRMLTYSVSRY